MQRYVAQICPRCVGEIYSVYGCHICDNNGIIVIDQKTGTYFPGKKVFKIQVTTEEEECI
jgi:hypothetical protein